MHLDTHETKAVIESSYVLYIISNPFEFNFKVVTQKTPEIGLLVLCVTQSEPTLDRWRRGKRAFKWECENVDGSRRRQKKNKK